MCNCVSGFNGQALFMGKNVEMWNGFHINNTKTMEKNYI